MVRRASSPRPNSEAMPCDSAQMWSAIIITGGRSRAGLLLFHLSNGHLYSHNPGTEGLVLTYSLRP